LPAGLAAAGEGQAPAELAAGEQTAAEGQAPVEPAAEGALGADAGGEKPFKGGVDVSAFFSAVPSVSEKFEPEAAALLNGCFDRVAECVKKTGGVVDAWSGGVATAAWSAAKNPVGAAFNAVRSALLLRLSLAEFNRGRDAGLPRLRIGCGIDTAQPNDAGGADTAAMAALSNDFFGTDILITGNIRDRIGRYLIIEEMPPPKTGEAPLFAVVNIRAAKPDQKQPQPSTLAGLRRILGTGVVDSAKAY
jgi:class 3 adenylate cyclase